jgi:hypothetical protein
MEQQTLIDKILNTSDGKLQNIFEWWEHSVKNDSDRVEWKVTLCDKHFGYDKNYTRLTDAEIVEIYLKEHPQESKEPISVDSVENAAIEYASYRGFNSNQFGIAKRAFKNGASWKEQQLKPLLESNKELLEALALKYFSKVIDDNGEWWIDCPDRGGFDTDIIDKAIENAKKLNDLK